MTKTSFGTDEIGWLFPGEGNAPPSCALRRRVSLISFDLCLGHICTAICVRTDIVTLKISRDTVTAFSSSPHASPRHPKTYVLQPRARDYWDLCCDCVYFCFGARVSGRRAPTTLHARHKQALAPAVTCCPSRQAVKNKPLEKGRCVGCSPHPARGRPLTQMCLPGAF